MIRLKFADTFCDSLKDFQNFLADHAKDEKNHYHVSVAEQFRSGIIRKWLLQEQAFEKGRGNDEEATLLQSLSEAVREIEGKLSTDRDIYSWLMRVFCSQTDASPRLNPFRFLEIDRLIARYDRGTKRFEGNLYYKVFDVAKEQFQLSAVLNGNDSAIGQIRADLKKDTLLEAKFEGSAPTEISGEDIAAVRFSMDGYEIPPEKVFLYMETTIEGIWFVANGGYVFPSVREGNSFPIRTSAIVSPPQDKSWVNDESRDIARYGERHNQFKSIGEFTPLGVARIGESGSFISYDGRILIPTFQKIWLVGEGLAAIRCSDGHIVFVSEDGDDMLWAEDLSEMSIFSEGFLAVKRASTGDWGYMKRDGTIIGSYAMAGDFRFGHATVFQKNWMGDKWLNIDTRFNETECYSPPKAIIPTKSPDSLDGMTIKRSNGGGYGLYTDDGYPVPILFNLPELGTRVLFEL